VDHVTVTQKQQKEELQKQKQVAVNIMATAGTVQNGSRFGSLQCDMENGVVSSALQPCSMSSCEGTKSQGSRICRRLLQE